MKNTKKLCLLLTIMTIGLSAVAEEVVVPKDVESEQQKVEHAEVKEIKANKETFEKAQEAMANKDFQSAIVYLSVYIDSKPKKYEAYKLRGECFYELRQYRLAQKDFETAIKLKTDDDKFVTGAKVFSAVVLGADKQDQYQNPELGNLYAMLMYAQKAQNNVAYEASYQDAGKYNSHIYLPKPDKNDISKINCPQKYGKKINQTGVNKYIYDAIDDIAKQDFNEAVYKVQYITSNYPKYYLGHYLTGVALVGLDQESQAIPAFETALKLNPYDFESYASLGQIYYIDAEKTFSKDYADKSIEYFKKALEYNPDCHMYYYYIGLNYLKMKDYDNAVENFDLAVKNKSNDYNSRYYKSIAQYMAGDYETVVDETTKLLYRHVSNYNSVLYLRALAQYKLGAKDEAIADIEKIQNNMNDIYDDDIKIVSAKEKTLDNYLYYLKAKITKDRGFGAIADLNNAFQNSAIKTLYSLDNSLVASKSAVLSLTSDDIDNQYDYLVTTFDNLDIRFAFVDSGYKLTAQKFPGKTVSVAKAKDSAEDVNLEPSIAQLLASNGLDAMTVKPKFETVAEPIAEDNAEVLTLNSQEENVEVEKKEVEPQIESQAVETEDGGVKIVAEEIKQSEDFTISYEKEPEKVAEEPKATESYTISYEKQPEDKVVEDTKAVENYTISYAKEPETVEVKKSEFVVEKYADVDLKKFNVSNNAELEVSPSDEVIEFKPEEKLIFNPESVAELPPFKITKPKKKSTVTEITEAVKTVVKEDAQEQVAEEEQNVEIKVAEAPDEDALAQENLGRVETTSENPLLQRVTVPTLISDSRPKVKEKEKSVASVVVSSGWGKANSKDEMDRINEAKFDEVETLLEEALESVQSAEIVEETKVKVKKVKKQKVKVKKEKAPKEKTEAEIAIEAIVQSVNTGETVEVVETVDSAEAVIPVEQEVAEVKETPVKVKKEKVKKERVKKVKVKKEKPIEDIVIEQEASEVEVVDLTPAITVINSEKTKKTKFRWKNLFKRKAKPVVEVSETVEEE